MPRAICFIVETDRVCELLFVGLAAAAQTFCFARLSPAGRGRPSAEPPAARIGDKHGGACMACCQPHCRPHSRPHCRQTIFRRWFFERAVPCTKRGLFVHGISSCCCSISLKPHLFRKTLQNGNKPPFLPHLFRESAIFRNK